MGKPLTAKKLKISFAEYGALIAVRTMLAQGIIQWARYDHGRNDHVFNMAYVCVDNGCGSIGCIGGTMALLMRVNPRDYMIRRHPLGLRVLFYPDTESPSVVFDYDLIQPMQAVKAIDNYLLTGKPRWRDVLKGSAAVRAE